VRLRLVRARLIRRQVPVARQVVDIRLIIQPGRFVIGGDELPGGVVDIVARIAVDGEAGNAVQFFVRPGELVNRCGLGAGEADVCEFKSDSMCNVL